MDGSERLRSRSYTNFHARHQHDIGQAYHTVQHGMHPYSATNGLGFVANNSSHMQYQQHPLSHSTYAGAFGPSSTSSHAAILLSYAGHASMPYSVQPPPRHATLPSQQRFLSRHFSTPSAHSTHSSPSMYLQRNFDSTALHDTEEQDSVNRESGQSEPVVPPLAGYPNVNDFDDLMKNYVAQLSPKKQDKALINAQRATNIRTVLSNKKTTAVESAQFRFWAKKMFSLQPCNGPGEQRKICHENKPIAVREKLFKILTRAHEKCQHGGRDKTSAQVRKVYSWVPKELISRFVKLCPTCKERRGGACANDEETVSSEQPACTMISDHMVNKVRKASSPSEDDQPPLKRRKSDPGNDNDHGSIPQMPPQLLDSSPAFQNQNRWLSDFEHTATHEDHFPTSTACSLRHDFKLESDMALSPASFTMNKNNKSKMKSASAYSPPHIRETQQYHYDQ